MVFRERKPPPQFPDCLVLQVAVLLRVVLTPGRFFLRGNIEECDFSLSNKNNHILLGCLLDIFYLKSSQSEA